MEDKEIIELYFKRNESAIDETAAKYGKHCLFISSNILNDSQDAEECVNDTYLKTWNSIPPVVPMSLIAYLSKIVRNLSLNRIKSRNTKKRGCGEYEYVYEELSNMIVSQETVEEAFDEMYLRDLINTWLGKLTKEQRMVFVGRYWYFESVDAISSKMNFKTSKTKMILMRLRNDLREYLESEGVHV